jgi:F0F1-type ATP synthase assembly protein I
MHLRGCHGVPRQPGDARVPERPPNAKELGYYVTLAQIGLEMAVPAGIGVALDRYFGWRTPWGVIAGAILGLVAGLAHLISLANQRQDSGSESRRDLK